MFYPNLNHLWLEPWTLVLGWYLFASKSIKQENNILFLPNKSTWHKNADTNDKIIPMIPMTVSFQPI